jgi:hypothetical protein
MCRRVVHARTPEMYCFIICGRASRVWCSAMYSDLISIGLLQPAKRNILPELVKLKSGAGDATGLQSLKPLTLKGCSEKTNV